MGMYRGLSWDLGGIYYHCSPGLLLVLYGYIARELHREVSCRVGEILDVVGMPPFLAAVLLWEPNKRNTSLSFVRGNQGREGGSVHAVV